MTRRRARRLAEYGVFVSIALLFPLVLSMVKAFGYSWSRSTVVCAYGCVGWTNDEPWDGWFLTGRHRPTLFWRPVVQPNVFAIPIWMFIVPVLVPSVLVLWRTRPPPPGHCQNCGYNLTGNVSGMCPECGTKVEQRRDCSER